MKRVVVKIGSNILADRREGLDTRRVSALAGDISELKAMGCDVVLVSSGAVAAGMAKLGFKEKPRDITTKQAAAAVGQSSLMWAYERSFGEHGVKVAQILLTREDFADRKRYINSKNTFLTLIGLGVLPIVNENDTVATDEIKFGDNDTLASLVAVLVGAERLIILSDVEGLYNEDPRISQSSQLIQCVEKITPDIERLAGGAGSMVGTGGMYSKVLAASRATSHGIGVNIITGKKKGLMVSIAQGNEQGTFFKPSENRISMRKGWIAHGSRSKGSIVLDAGAVKAIREMGKSLLPSGIIGVEGEFELGDAVQCLSSDGKRVGKGISNYSHMDLKRIMGRRTSEIEGILGFKYSDEVIHRDNMVVF